MVDNVKNALAGCGLDRFDAAALMARVLRLDVSYLAAHPEKVLAPDESAGFRALVRRRLAGEPIAYITGTREFFSLEFKVTPAVLIPRPETELLVEFALERLPERDGYSVLDLGTGSGCIAISIAKHRPSAHVVAVDHSVEALQIANENATRHAVDNLEIVCSEWFSALEGRMFDVMVANPPYVASADPHLDRGDVRFEPRGALVATGDGLDCIRLLVASASRYLHPNGWLALEHGYDQGAAVRDLMVGAGYCGVASRTDLAGIERICTGTWDAKS